MLNSLVAPEDFSACGMEALLVNQLIDRRTLDERGIELYERLRPKEPPVQARGDELFYLSILNLQGSFYVGTVIPDEVIAVLEDVHEMSFADVPIVRHKNPLHSDSMTHAMISRQ